MPTTGKGFTLIFIESVLKQLWFVPALILILNEPDEGKANEGLCVLLSVIPSLLKSHAHCVIVSPPVTVELS